MKNRMHLDLRVAPDDVEAVVARLLDRGATRLHDGHQGPFTWVTLVDPEGNEFLRVPLRAQPDRQVVAGDVRAGVRAHLQHAAVGRRTTQPVT